MEGGKVENIDKRVINITERSEGRRLVETGVLD